MSHFRSCQRKASQGDPDSEVYQKALWTGPLGTWGLVLKADSARCPCSQPLELGGLPFSLSPTSPFPKPAISSDSHCDLSRTVGL